MMKRSNIGLLDFFTGEMRSALEKFCKMVNQANADVIVLMAHKAVLLYNILVAQGYIFCNKQTIVVTSFALDFDASYIKEKRILILDDIVISGTSIASIVNKLLRLGARQEDIEIIAAATDSTYLGMRFDLPNGQEAMHYGERLEEDLCIELSASISKAFAYYGIPYDVDFPAYEGILIEQEQFHSLFNDLFWNTVNVSNINHTCNSVAIHTLFPTQIIAQRLWKEINFDLSECIETKIRLFINNYPNGTIEATIVPMCLFNEIKREDVDILFQRLFLKDFDINCRNTLPYVAKIRYIEFYLSHILYKVFIKHTIVNCQAMFDRENTLQLFGPKTGGLIFAHLKDCEEIITSDEIVQIRCQNRDGHIAIEDQCNISDYEGSDLYESRKQEGLKWKESENYNIGCWLNQFIFDPFLWWRDYKEIPVREELKERELHYIKDYKEIEEKYLYRLKNGWPLSSLDKMLSRRVPEIAEAERKYAISIFIDRAIDEGIVVPTIHSGKDDQYFCRAYRHGEDLPFGISDQYRFVTFVKYLGEMVHFGKIYKNNEEEKSHICDSTVPVLSEIAFEKICVLFYQMGLKKGGIFNRFLGFNNFDIIHGFLSVHGSVVGFTKSEAEMHLYSTRNAKGEKYITWLSKWLSDKGLVENTDSTSRSEQEDSQFIDHERKLHLNLMIKYLEENNRSTISESVDKSIRSLATIIGRWYNASKKILFRDNASALTSCANKYVFVSAIATEMHYFSLYWENQAKYALTQPFSSLNLINRLSEKSEDQDNERYTKTIRSALYSGRQKVDWRMANAAKEIVKEVGNNYLENDTDSEQWNRFWNDVDQFQEGSACDTLAQLTNAAIGYLYFYSACLDLLQSRDFWDNNFKPRDYDMFRSAYIKQVENNAKIESDLFDRLDKFIENKSLSLQSRATELLHLVNKVLKKSKKCYKQIEALVWSLDPTYTVEYTSALIVDLEPISTDESATDALLMKLWENIEENEDKTELNIISMSHADSGHKAYGIFFGISKNHLLDRSVQQKNRANENGKYLIQRFKELLTLTSGKVYSIKGILIPQISINAYFKHNLKRNIERHSNEFFTEQVLPFICNYNSEANVQLLIGLDHYVSTDFERTTVPQCLGLTVQQLPTQEKLEYDRCFIVTTKPQKQPNSNNVQNRCVYSQLIIESQNQITKEKKVLGLGMLIRTKNSVVCITCNHLFEKLQNNEIILASSAFIHGVHFELTLLTEINPYLNKNHFLPADKEVCILQPKWETQIPFDIKHLITYEDWLEDASDKNCRCYRKVRGGMAWTNNRGEIVGYVDEGYYQLNGLSSEIKKGCSGGICKAVNDSNQLIGIHVGRFGDDDTISRIIPWLIIKSVIEKFEEA